MDEAERRRLNSEEDAEVFMTDKKTDKTKRAPRTTGTNKYVPEFSDACIHSAVSDKEFLTKAYGYICLALVFLKKCFENLLMVEYAPFEPLKKRGLET